MVTKPKRVEVRYQNDALDEVVAYGCDFHLEQMSDTHWWFSIAGADGSEWHFWIGSRTGQAKVDCRVTESLDPIENATLKAELKRRRRADRSPSRPSRGT